MAEVLVVHSSGPQGPQEGSGPFVARLREELGSAYRVSFPLMPDPDNPQYEPWSERLEQALAEIEGPIVMVGHSLGGSVALKHLPGSDRRESVDRVVLVETPFWGSSDWEAEWALPEDWPAPASEMPPILLFHSRDDEEIPFAHLDLYAKRIPQATTHPLDGNGHLLDRGDLSEVLDAIRGRATG
jgi:predicted alpha/beta hydrolase family esterase